MCKFRGLKDIGAKGKIVDPNLELQARINSIIRSANRIGRLIEQVNDALRRLEDIIQQNAEAEKSEDEQGAEAEQLEEAQEIEGAEKSEEPHGGED